MRPPLLTLACCLLLAAAARAATGPDPLVFRELDLLDGRQLRHVVVRSYDAASGKVLVVADGTALLLPLTLVPPPIRRQLAAAAPDSGVTVSSAPTAAPPIPAGAPTAPAAAAAPEDTAAILAAHTRAAQARAEKYYRFEFHAGSNNISVSRLEFEFDDPRPVDGWPGRYDTEGKAYLEFYDSKGGDFQRTTSTFEVVTAQQGAGPPRVVSFTRKS